MVFTCSGESVPVPGVVGMLDAILRLRCSHVLEHIKMQRLGALSSQRFIHIHL